MRKERMESNIHHLAVNTIRMLAVDAVQKANSGHPGMPMGMADCAYVLWSKYLRYNPEDPAWPNRDRFILSAGHGSILLYGLLHISGFDVTLDDLKAFRQLGSRTPGHPERECLPGVETTTGPLGQGFANGVGMALAQSIMAQKFNMKTFSPIQHHVYSIVSDGDIMEGVSSEAASIAGHLGLGTIIYIYDDNHITIDGSTDITFSEDTAKRFQALGWHTKRIDGHDHQQIADAIQEGIDEVERPTLILARTHIGYGSPNKQDNASSHGAPLGEDEVQKTKKNLGWPLDPTFHVPSEVYELFRQRVKVLKEEYEAWQRGFKEWYKNHSDLADCWQRMHDTVLPEELEKAFIQAVSKDAKATRAHGADVLQKASELIPSLYGGSADLGYSTKTIIQGLPSIGPGNYKGRNIHFGIREHAMGSILNGMALYGGFIPYGSTFFVFSDYMRPAIRLSALMGIRVVWIFTHDSIFVGEDGPTHQPVEHLAALRAIPNLVVFRPADGLETAMAWSYALRRKDGPTALCLTRQRVPVIHRPEGFDTKIILRGGYILSDSAITPDVILVATGSEVAVAVEAKALLSEKGFHVRVVSMPSFTLFQEQSKTYCASVIPEKSIPVAVVEAGLAQGWHVLTRAPMHMIGMSQFGTSAPYQDLEKHFGITGTSVADRVGRWLKKLSQS